MDIRKEKNRNLINPKEIRKKVINGTQIIVLVAREVAKEFHEMIFPAMALISHILLMCFPKISRITCHRSETFNMLLI